MKKTENRGKLAFLRKSGEILRENCGKCEKNSPPCFGRFAPANRAIRAAQRHKTRFWAAGEGNKISKKDLQNEKFVLTLQPENNN